MKMTRLMACITGLVLVSCPTDNAPDQSRLQVVATIQPLAEFVEQVGGEHVQVMIMVPPGASPHTYEPTPNQMTQLSTAQLYVKVGTRIEFELVWLDKLLAMNTAIQICDVSANITTITTENHDYERNHTIDPHIWLSVRNASTIIETIYRALSRIDPRHELDYHMNATAYRTKLDSLDQVIMETLAEKKHRMFITYHPAWHYLARDYHLEQQVIEVGNKVPSAKTIQQVIETARQHRIHVVFASPQFDRRYADNIAREINGQVILIDPLAADYINNMGTIAHALARNME